MKFVLVFAVLVAAVSAEISYKDVFLKEWELYKLQYKKSYASEVQDALRMKVFKENKFKIASHNIKYYKGEVSYVMGINQFTDKLPSEFQGTAVETVAGYLASKRKVKRNP